MLSVSYTPIDVYKRQLQAFFATALNIKKAMGADHGVIIKLDQARGIQKALQRMAEIAVKEAGTTKDKRLVIAHCNAPERAQSMTEKLCSCLLYTSRCV